VFLVVVMVLVVTEHWWIRWLYLQDRWSGPSDESVC